MNKLEKIAREIKNCKECKKKKSGKPVPGEGNKKAKILFVGEAPGREEAKTGKPFMGRSGKLLTQLLNSIKLDRKDIFITSPVKYYPGKRTPTNKEIDHGKIHLLKQIEAIKPKLIVLLGAVAHKALIGNVKISEIHGKKLQKNKVTYFSTFHPAAALRFPFIKEFMKKDFKKLKRIISF